MGRVRVVTKITIWRYLLAFSECLTSWNFKVPSLDCCDYPPDPRKQTSLNAAYIEMRVGSASDEMVNLYCMLCYLDSRNFYCGLVRLDGAPQCCSLMASSTQVTTLHCRVNCNTSHCVVCSPRSVVVSSISALIGHNFSFMSATGHEPFGKELLEKYCVALVKRWALHGSVVLHLSELFYVTGCNISEAAVLIRLPGLEVLRGPDPQLLHADVWEQEFWPSWLHHQPCPCPAWAASFLSRGRGTGVVPQNMQLLWVFSLSVCSCFQQENVWSLAVS